jgi:hypothetical protein
MHSAQSTAEASPLLIGDAAFAEVEAFPRLGTEALPQLLQVLWNAGGEVIDTDNALSQLEKGLEQVRTDEAGDPGDEPCPWFRLEFSPGDLGQPSKRRGRLRAKGGRGDCQTIEVVPAMLESATVCNRSGSRTAWDRAFPL